MHYKTVRELGGEFWAELNMDSRDPNSKFAGLDFRVKGDLADFLMTILARHVGAMILNDEGLAVEPRPRPEFRETED